MILSLVLLAALAYAPEPAAPSAAPPQQAVAIIDGAGMLKITQVASGGFGPAAQAMEVTVGPMDKPVTVIVKTTTVQLTTVELPAKYVEAYTVDGTPIAREKLTEMLAKERTVLVAMDGKKLDPFHLQLYKESTIVLVPPANTMTAGGGPFPGPGGFYVQPPLPIPPPLPPNPFPPDKKP
jgi:hypothetical protein